MLRNTLGGGALSSRGDDAVRDTNDDAQLSKLSCVRHGYFQDSFVHHFVRRPARRSPLINRGYYSRYAALRSLLLQFLALGLGSSDGGAPIDISTNAGATNTSSAQPQTASGVQTGQQEDQQQHQAEGPPQQPPAAAAQHAEGQQQAGQEGQAAAAASPPPSVRKQILVLGAGYDTTFFQLASEGIRADKYVEIDFLQVTQKKAAAIQQLPDLLACIGGDEAASSISPAEGRVVTPGYCLLPADLRDPAQLQAAVQAAGLDPAAPTLVLSECVLVYLKPQHSREVVRWLAEHLQTAAFAVYEQIQPHDAFGQQMMINLESRGCSLLGIEATPTLEAHKQRFTDCGWHRAEAHTMDHVYSHCIDPQERRRIERLELFDEFEEWHLIQQHYCIAIGVKDSSGLLQRFGLPHYSQPQSQQQVLGGRPLFPQRPRPIM